MFYKLHSQKLREIKIHNRNQVSDNLAGRFSNQSVQRNFSQLLHGSHMDWKTWKMGKLFPVRENSGNFEDWKSRGILPKLLEK